jgi:hypothetical protein
VLCKIIKYCLYKQDTFPKSWMRGIQMGLPTGNLLQEEDAWCFCRCGERRAMPSFRRIFLL